MSMGYVTVEVEFSMENQGVINDIFNQGHLSNIVVHIVVIIDRNSCLCALMSSSPQIDIESVFADLVEVATVSVGAV